MTSSYMNNRGHSICSHFLMSGEPWIVGQNNYNECIVLSNKYVRIECESLKAVMSS